MWNQALLMLVNLYLLYYLIVNLRIYDYESFYVV